jgi:hypothetical protein
MGFVSVSELGFSVYPLTCSVGAVMNTAAEDIQGTARLRSRWVFTFEELTAVVHPGLPRAESI